MDAFHFRGSTIDRWVFNGVVGNNEYELPPHFAPDDIIIDVGTHIGAFAYAAARRGSENIYCIEADRANYDIAATHLRAFIEQGSVRLFHGAVWRSDPNDDTLYFDGYHPFPKSYAGMEGIINTGNGSVIWGEGEPVPKFALDEIVDSLTDGGQKHIRLLKLDCEGSEWPILLTSQRLHLIDEICGEFHELGGEFLEISEDRSVKDPIFCVEGQTKYTIDRLERFLRDAGFVVTYQRHQRPTGALEGLGLFFAKRPDASDETV